MSPSPEQIHQLSAGPIGLGFRKPPSGMLRGIQSTPNCTRAGTSQGTGLDLKQH